QPLPHKGGGALICPHPKHLPHKGGGALTPSPSNGGGLGWGCGVSTLELKHINSLPLDGGGLGWGCGVSTLVEASAFALKNSIKR
ncbi:MAG: hypothetical protein B7Y07_08445, partial [Halothiobacillus sp. 24-54-40]